MAVIQLTAWILAISPTPVCYDSDVPRSIDSEEWTLVKSTEGVQTSYRWLTNDKGVAYRERRGEINVNCLLLNAVHMVSDAESTKKWMSSIAENYKLTTVSKNEWYTYTLFSIPWPFTKRDLISFYKVTTDPADGSVTIAITCKDKYIPMKSGISRLTDYRATWEIAQQGAGNTHIIFKMSSTTPPAFPRSIQDPIIERMFHKNMVHLKEMLLEGQGLSR